MNWLIDKLTKPEIGSDGIVRMPNAIMRKAAEVIKNISAMGNADTAARVKAEAGLVDNETMLSRAWDNCSRMKAEINEINAGHPTAKAEYRNAMNEDYESSIY